MWILDSCARSGIELWDRDGGTRCEYIPEEPEFYLHLPDPHAHREMLAALESSYPVRECTFRTVSGELAGYRITAGRDVAGAIERQSRQSARLYNVDVRLDQKYLAEHGLFPCGHPHESRFSPDIAHDLREIHVRIPGIPGKTAPISSVDVTVEHEERFTGTECEILSDLTGCIDATDPDVILFPHADIWMAHLVRKARDYGIEAPFSRSGKFRTLDSRSYWSYGRMEHRNGAFIPDGRLLVDTEQSFVYREGGLAGVLLTARLTGLSPNLTSRFTPGTLVSGYEVFGALMQGIAIPFRKSEPECVRRVGALRAADRGGMMFQPVAGIYEQVCQIDFTSLYPAIIVQSNLSPETIGHPERRGFLPGVLEPLLLLRIRTKRMKRDDGRYKGIDSVLKWMLVTCFGYTGYKNAKFGRIEVHEAITARSREILLQTKHLAEETGFSVLHGIVDSLWVKGRDPHALKVLVEREIRLFTELEQYDWLVFLPLADGSGAYTRYYGRLDDGSIKVRGIAARRHDTPEYIRRMQQEQLTVMAGAANLAALAATEDAVSAIHRTYVQGLAAAKPEDMVIHKRISRLAYIHRCLEGAAVQEYLAKGMDISPGMKIGYVVRDARHYGVDPEESPSSFDRAYYWDLLEKAWGEIAFVFRQIPEKNKQSARTLASASRGKLSA
jgi:DNA polymerase, archaea type